MLCIITIFFLDTLTVTIRKKKSVKDQACHSRRITVNSKAPDLHRVRIGEKDGGGEKAKREKKRKGRKRRGWER